MKLPLICLLILSATVIGCGAVNEKESVESFSKNVSADEHFEHQLSDLLEQLIRVEQFSYQEKSIAFTTLVWIETLTLTNSERAYTLLGHQISSSLKTALVQRGGKVVEHKSAQAISMADNASYYLTRKLSELSQEVDVSYVLAGTMLEMKGGVEVNIEVIDVNSHSVVSSARTFIGNEYLPRLNSTFVKEGKIYRRQL
ncbi:FlgO family outer membrane protein [Colwellia ponticola]|uniref:FlgO domain-containing protein n=1 Tax=Colwellia ponticola TaxID=2304625 RepID=A0A8H2JK59_9GAMM|nr:FlgO family outer membrane protein [Colwellia ponticola]TMM43118.1 hypothetical protein FCS21_13385 [Colwellia ponticola]